MSTCAAGSERMGRSAGRSRLAETMHAKIKGSKLVVLPKSGHMTFVDQPRMFIDAVDNFLHPRP